MKGRTDTTGVDENTGFILCEKGEHNLQIVRIKDKTTENGDPMVSIGMTVINGPSEGAWVWDNIVIPLPGSKASAILGRTKHFLHCIGEPYEGQIEYDSDRWMTKKLVAKIDHEAPNKYHKDIKAFVSAYTLEEENIPSVQLGGGTFAEDHPAKEEEVPF